jgi:hypothetical protein
VRGSAALKRLEEERLTQLAGQAKQYITLMEEYRSVPSQSWRSICQYHHTH